MKKALAILILAALLIVPSLALAENGPDLDKPTETTPVVPNPNDNGPDINHVVTETEITSASVPKTADTSIVWLYGALAVIGVAGAALVVRKIVAE